MWDACVRNGGLGLDEVVRTVGALSRVRRVRARERAPDPPREIAGIRFAWRGKCSRARGAGTARRDGGGNGGALGPSDVAPARARAVCAGARRAHLGSE